MPEPQEDCKIIFERDPGKAYAQKLIQVLKPEQNIFDTEHVIVVSQRDTKLKVKWPRSPWLWCLRLLSA